MSFLASHGELISSHYELTVSYSRHRLHTLPLQILCCLAHNCLFCTDIFVQNSVLSHIITALFILTLLHHMTHEEMRLLLYAEQNTLAAMEQPQTCQLISN